MRRRIVIRRVRPEEGLLLRELRLRSLTDSPEAFGQTLEEASLRPDLDWHASALRASEGQGRIWLIAELDGAPFGLVQGRRRPPGTLLVFSMWVDPAGRRLGIGRRLITGLETWAHGWGATDTILWVLRGNETACGFYRRLGFRVIEVGADVDAGDRYDASAMRRAMPPDPSGDRQAS